MEYRLSLIVPISMTGEQVSRLIAALQDVATQQNAFIRYETLPVNPPYLEISHLIVRSATWIVRAARQGDLIDNEYTRQVIRDAQVCVNTRLLHHADFLYVFEDTTAWRDDYGDIWIVKDGEARRAGR